MGSGIGLGSGIGSTRFLLKNCFHKTKDFIFILRKSTKKLRMRMRQKIDKRRMESQLDVVMETPQRRRRSALDIDKIKLIEHEAKHSNIISKTDIAEKNRHWMRQSPLDKFKLLQKRVILIIRCYGILKSYAYDGRVGKFLTFVLSFLFDFLTSCL